MTNRLPSFDNVSFYSVIDRHSSSQSSESWAKTGDLFDKAIHDEGYRRGFEKSFLCACSDLMKDFALLAERLKNVDSCDQDDDELAATVAKLCSILLTGDFASNRFSLQGFATDVFAVEVVGIAGVAMQMPWLRGKGNCASCACDVEKIKGINLLGTLAEHLAATNSRIEDRSYIIIKQTSLNCDGSSNSNLRNYRIPNCGSRLIATMC
jgi:hypothetical protein